LQLDISKTDEEIKSLFENLSSKSDLANLLEIPETHLNYYLYSAENYKSFNIPKKDGSFRTINAPKTNIKIIQSKLYYIFNLIFAPHKSSFGFVQGRSIIDNASIHLNSSFILNIDLKDFFPSIHLGRVRGFFHKKLGVNEEISLLLSKLVCIEESGNSYLPQGAPTSPIISNMILTGMDHRLFEFAAKYDSIYSRYADDITISTKKLSFPTHIAKKDLFGDTWLSLKLNKIINDSSFKINFQKVRLRSNKQRQEVTGLIVNRDKLNVKRDYIRNISAILYNWEKKGYEYTQELYITKYWKPKDSKFKTLPKIEQFIEGKLNFLKMVKGSNDKIYKKLSAKYSRLKNQS